MLGKPLVLVSFCVLTGTAILLGSCSITPSPELEPIVLGRSVDLKGQGRTVVLHDLQQPPFLVAENRKGTVAYKALTFELSEVPKTAHLDILMTVVTYACATKPGLPQGRTNVQVNQQPVASWSFGYADQGKSYRTRIDLDAKSLRVGQNKLEIVGSVCLFGNFEVVRFNGIALVM